MVCICKLCDYLLLIIGFYVLSNMAKNIFMFFYKNFLRPELNILKVYGN